MSCTSSITFCSSSVSKSRSTSRTRTTPEVTILFSSQALWSAWIDAMRLDCARVIGRPSRRVSRFWYAASLRRAAAPSYPANAVTYASPCPPPPSSSSYHARSKSFTASFDGSFTASRGAKDGEEGALVRRSPPALSVSAPEDPRIHAFERQEGVPLGVAATKLGFEPWLPPRALPGRLPRKDPPSSPPSPSPSPPPRSVRSVHGDAFGAARAGVSSHSSRRTEASPVSRAGGRRPGVSVRSRHRSPPRARAKMASMPAVSRPEAPAAPAPRSRVWDPRRASSRWYSRRCESLLAASPRSPRSPRSRRRSSMSRRTSSSIPPGWLGVSTR